VLIGKEQVAGDFVGRTNGGGMEIRVKSAGK
jgi:hypothetical protein